MIDYARIALVVAASLGGLTALLYAMVTLENWVHAPFDNALLAGAPASSGAPSPVAPDLAPSAAESCDCRETLTAEG